MEVYQVLTFNHNTWHNREMTWTKSTNNYRSWRRSTLKMSIQMTSSRLSQFKRQSKSLLFKKNNWKVKVRVPWRKRRIIDKKIRVHPKIQRLIINQKVHLNSQMEVGNAPSAKTITLREGRSAIDAKRQEPPKISLVNLHI